MTGVLIVLALVCLAVVVWAKSLKPNQFARWAERRLYDMFEREEARRIVEAEAEAARDVGAGWTAEDRTAFKGIRL